MAENQKPKEGCNNGLQVGKTKTRSQYKTSGSQTKNSTGTISKCLKTTGNTRLNRTEAITKCRDKDKAEFSYEIMDVPGRVQQKEKTMKKKFDEKIRLSSSGNVLVRESCALRGTRDADGKIRQNLIRKIWFRNSCSLQKSCDFDEKIRQSLVRDCRSQRATTCTEVE